MMKIQDENLKDSISEVLFFFTRLHAFLNKVFKHNLSLVSRVTELGSHLPTSDPLPCRKSGQLCCWEPWWEWGLGWEGDTGGSSGDSGGKLENIMGASLSPERPYSSV